MIDANIIIVGAGLAGASTAFHLRAVGAPSVLIIEREAVAGAHSSGRNAAMVRSVVDDPVNQPLIAEGALRLAAGELAPYRGVGSLLIGHGDADDVATHLPLAQGRGLYTPTDGVIDVAALLQRYLRDQRVLFDTTLVSWRAAGDGVEVETNRGTLRGRVLVNAAGAWAGRLGDLPLEPLLRHLFVTPPDPAIDPKWPFVWDVSNGLYFRPESQGLLLCPCDELETEPGDYTERWAAFDLLIDKVDRLQPRLRTVTQDLSIKHRWAGQRTFAPDRRAVIGFDHREPRLFWVAGLGGHGVTASPAVGRLAAELLAGRSSTPGAYSSKRFGRHAVAAARR